MPEKECSIIDFNYFSMVGVVIWLFREVILCGRLPVSLPRLSFVQNSEVVSFRRLQSCIIYKKSIRGWTFCPFYRGSPLLGESAIGDFTVDYEK